MIYRMNFSEKGCRFVEVQWPLILKRWQIISTIFLLELYRQCGVFFVFFLFFFHFINNTNWLFISHLCQIHCISLPDSWGGFDEHSCYFRSYKRKGCQCFSLNLFLQLLVRCILTGYCWRLQGLNPQRCPACPMWWIMDAISMGWGLDCQVTVP